MRRSVDSGPVPPMIPRMRVTGQPHLERQSADGHDDLRRGVRLHGKEHPFKTKATRGLGTTERDYAAACRGATIGEGLAVRGEEVHDAAPAVGSWLRRIGSTT
jgi:hypothetical protein